MNNFDPKWVEKQALKKVQNKYYEYSRMTCRHRELYNKVEKLKQYWKDKKELLKANSATLVLLCGALLIALVLFGEDRALYNALGIASITGAIFYAVKKWVKPRRE